ncbi:MAG: hypothetical protein JXN61_13980 [Sedimentisphaerales bacterium]|nr:hypothetical protein [Sedimentisphaerales bacterium]
MIGFITSSPTVSTYLYQLPIYAVWIIGICLCLNRWQRHPRISAVAMAGFSLLFLESLIGTLLSYHLLPRLFDRFGGYNAWVHSSFVLARSLIEAGLWVFILAVIFGWRDRDRAGSVKPGHSIHPSVSPVTLSEANPEPGRRDEGSH